MTTTSTKLCKDCVHFNLGNKLRLGWCERPLPDADLVYGRTVAACECARDERAIDSPSRRGPSGRHFQPKPPKVSWWRLLIARGT